MQDREMLTTLDIPEDVGPILAGALPAWNPVSVAYTDADGKPHLGFRGSTMRYSNTQLSIWARAADGGGLVKALPTNPHLAFLYADWAQGDPVKRIYLNFVGKGRVETDAGVRKKIYDALPQVEKDYDPEAKGVAVVVDVEEIMGLLPGRFLKMSKA